MTVRTFVPRLAMRFCTSTAEPRPTATSTITAATPIVIPSTVSADRILFAAMPRSAIMIPSRLITRSPPSVSGRRE